MRHLLEEAAERLFENLQEGHYDRGFYKEQANRHGNIVEKLKREARKSTTAEETNSIRNLQTAHMKAKEAHEAAAKAYAKGDNKATRKLSDAADEARRNAEGVAEEHGRRFGKYYHA